MLGDTLLTMFLYVECIQSWVIPASLDETRNLLTTRWEMAIISELHSTLWVDPESPRSSLFRMTDVGRYVARDIFIFGMYPKLGHSSEFRRD